MTGCRPFLRIPGVLVALAFAVQTTFLPAVHPCMAHDEMGEGVHAHHGAAAAHHASPDGMDAEHMAAMPGASERHDDTPAHHDTPCTCADCACCAVAVTLPQAPGDFLAVSIAFVDQPVARERGGAPAVAPDVVLPPSIGPPALDASLS